MHRNRLTAALSSWAAVCTTLACALALTGCAASPAAGSTGAGSTGAPAAGPANLMVYSINSDGPDLRAIVTGAVGDYGPAVTVLPDGQVDPSHSHDLKLSLTRGSLRLRITELDQKFVNATSHEPVYPRTCSDFVSVTAAVPVVAGSGTGVYRGISGSFTVTATLDEIEAKPCEPDNGFVWQAVVFAGPGRVSLG
jgi:hypothetical protein